MPYICEACQALGDMMALMMVNVAYIKSFLITTQQYPRRTNEPPKICMRIISLILIILSLIVDRNLAVPFLHQKRFFLWIFFLGTYNKATSKLNQFNEPATTTQRKLKLKKCDKYRTHIYISIYSIVCIYFPLQMQLL